MNPPANVLPQVTLVQDTLQREEDATFPLHDHELHRLLAADRISRLRLDALGTSDPAALDRLSGGDTWQPLIDTFRVLSLDDAFQPGAGAEDAQRQYIRLRRDLDVGAFGAYAIRAESGDLVRERTANGPAADAHEELYVVVDGHASFTVDGQEIDAPAGTAIFVRDVDVKRSAVTKDGSTTVLVVSGRRGQAWRPTPGEATEEFWPLYEAKDYEGALQIVRQALEEYPGNPLAHYNVACMTSLLGRPDDAIEHLQAALDGHPDYAENARTDDDFAPLRDDPRFKELVGES